MKAWRHPGTGDMKESPNNALLLPRLAPLLVLLPLAVIFMDGLLSFAFGWHDPVNDVVGAVSNPRLEAMGRTRVLASLLPFTLVAALLTIQFARDYFILFDRRARRLLLVPILLWLAAASTVIALQSTGHGTPHEVVGSNFVEDAFGGIRASGSGMTLAEMLKKLILAFSMLLTFGAGSAIVGTISSLAVPAPSLPEDSAERVRRMQRTRLDGYMYGSALLLVTGLFFIDACMRWPAPFSTDQKLYMEHVNALMLGSGVYYSTIIASYYLPAALWMGRFAPEDGTGEELGGAAPVSMAGLLKVFLALISPAVAGILTQLIDSVAR